MKENKGKKGEKGKEDNQGDLSGEETVGEILFSARMKSGVSRGEISEVTRIPEEALKYLETDNFDMLPARVYVRGFLRNFAGELGLDVEHILEKYEVQTGQTHISKGDFWEIKEKVIEEEKSPVSFSKNLILYLFGIIVVVIIVLLALQSEKDPEAVPPNAIPDMEEFMSKETIETRDPSVIPSSGDSIKTIKVKKTPNTKTVKKKDFEPLKLKIVANSSDTTWFDLIAISLMDGNPDTTYYDFILFPGVVKTLTATDAFIFRTIGNAGGFGIEFKGKKVPSLGERNEVVKNIYFGRDSISLTNN